MCIFIFNFMRDLNHLQRTFFPIYPIIFMKVCNHSRKNVDEIADFEIGFALNGLTITCKKLKLEICVRYF